MTFLDSIVQFYLSQPFVRRYLVPFLGCIIVYFIFKKRREFSRHALQNTAASVIVFWVNLGMIALFYDEIAAAIQQFYTTLNVPSLNPAFWESVPFWLVVIVGIVAKDFVYYWCHRIMHTKWGWPTHAAHHSDTHVNGFTAYRVHFLEWLMMVCGYFFLLTWLQIPDAIPIVVFLHSLHNVYVHMDLPYTHGPLRHIIASPSFHRWHHADVPEAYGKNLANIMPMWDHIFGTHYTYDIVPDAVPMGAVKTGIEDKNPLMIYVYPVLEWSRLVRTSLWSENRDGKAPKQTDIPAE